MKKRTYGNLHIENKRGQEERQIGKHVKEGRRVTLEKKKKKKKKRRSGRERELVYILLEMKGGKWVGMKWGSG